MSETHNQRDRREMAERQDGIHDYRRRHPDERKTMRPRQIMYTDTPRRAAAWLTRQYMGESWKRYIDLRRSDPLDWTPDQERYDHDPVYHAALELLFRMMIAAGCYITHGKALTAAELERLVTDAPVRRERFPLAGPLR